jgi:Luciferase-like monooxygenase
VRGLVIKRRLCGEGSYGPRSKGRVWFTDALSAAQLVELAQRTEQLGYAALWYPEVFSYESFGHGGFLLAHTKKLIVASGISNIYARDAHQLVEQRLGVLEVGGIEPFGKPGVDRRCGVRI